MSLLGSLVILALLGIAVIFVIAVALGKLLRLNRMHLEDAGIAMAVTAVRKFIDRDDAGDVKICVRQFQYYDEVLPEEEAGLPDPCVICREFGRKESEDARLPLEVIGGWYIPLCTGHKNFVREFKDIIKKRVESRDEPEWTPSE